MNCLISLKPLDAKKKHDGESHDGARKALFGRASVKPRLNCSRAELFREAVKYVKGMSISGVQQKLSLKIEQGELVPTTTDGEFILKPSPETFPHAAENEQLGMEISRLLGIPTAACGLIRFSDGELAYITRRFDRLVGDIKVHQEDLAQAQGFASADKYRGTYEDAGKKLYQMSGNKLSVVADLINRLMQAYLIGNGDMHLKNISLQRDIANTSRFYDRLTPNYDQLSTALYTEMDTQGFLALGLLADADGEEAFSEAYQHYGYYTGRDFITLGTRLGINDKAIRVSLQNIATKKKEVLSLIDRSFLPDNMKQDFGHIINERARALSLF
jgi:serine/threonine-protein kinase HipA